MDLDFLKEMGEALKGAGIDSPEAMEKALVAKVKDLGLDVDDLDIAYEKGTATVQGMAADQATREKVLLAVGNTQGVMKVTDELAVGFTKAEQEAMRAAAAARAAAVTAEAKAKEGAEKQAEMKARYDLEQRRMAFRRELQERRKAAEEASKTVFYTVVKGDSLRKIAKKHYGDEGRWQEIFEANQPMIKKADLIYPGQMLRIPN